MVSAADSLYMLINVREVDIRWYELKFPKYLRFLSRSTQTRFVTLAITQTSRHSSILIHAFFLISFTFFYTSLINTHGFFAAIAI